ncbi:MAG: dynamin family protein [Verrucomicrobiae bacterium]|nr:dynamin family protein [Verrucomicrobiae bacterium]
MATADLLSPRWEHLLADERAALRQVAEALARIDADPEDRHTLESSVAQLDQLFLVVVVGEFNAGKSSLLNALLGTDVLAVGVTPTTARIHLIRQGPHATSHEGADGVLEIEVPAAHLDELTLVDTPGTNSLDRAHDVLTRRFVPRADLVLVVTSADRPFSESERSFLAAIHEWGKKLVFVVSKVDILEGPRQVDEVVAWVEAAARQLVGTSAPVFPVSARLALQDPSARERSGMAALERHFAETLGDTERLRLKLGNPLGVALRLADRYHRALDERVPCWPATWRPPSDSMKPITRPGHGPARMPMPLPGSMPKTGTRIRPSAGWIKPWTRDSASTPGSWLVTRGWMDCGSRRNGRKPSNSEQRPCIMFFSGKTMP